MVTLLASFDQGDFVACAMVAILAVLLVVRYGWGHRVINRMFLMMTSWLGRPGTSRESIRARRLSEWAQGRGWAFDYCPDEFPEKREFWAFQGGIPSYTKYLATGDFAGRPVQAFDYCYTVTEMRGKCGVGNAPRELSAVIIEAPFPLGRLLIRRENRRDKMKELVGVEDINFESAEFSQKFFVAADDKKWAYAVLNQAAMEFLLAHDQGAAIEFSGHKALACFSTPMSVREFDVTVELLTGLLDRIPDYVVQQQADLINRTGI